MLLELSIRNFALISNIQLQFDKGLHVFTGETGAGKSMIIDAISMLTGGRATTDVIRAGQKKAEIEAMFSCEANHPIFSLLDEWGIEWEDDTVIIRRDISYQGKSICRINGKMVTLAYLREAGRLLIDIHGQHEHQHLLFDQHHLPLLDSYGAAQLSKHLEEYTLLFKKYQKISQTVKQLSENEQSLIQKLDLLKFQYQEIAAAELEADEEEAIKQEAHLFKHSQKLFNGLEASYQLLQSENGAIDQVGAIGHYLQELASFDQSLQPLANTMDNIFYQLEDIQAQLRKYKDSLHFEPERLAVLEERIHTIEQLKRKYGKSIQQILEYFSKIEEELESIENRDEKLQEALSAQSECLLDMMLEAKALEEVRKSVASELQQAIMDQLKDLYMEYTQVEIAVTPSRHGERAEINNEVVYIRSDGWNHVQFLIAPNPGEGLKPLSKIASGGELSRLTLALKTVFAKLEPITTLIFDEVDSGVSGRVAQAMADKLYTIGLNEQVICITHQPQLAAMADHHFRIEKNIKQDGTETLIKNLPYEERRLELAKIISGENITELTISHAEEMLAQADTRKAEIQDKLSK